MTGGRKWARMAAASTMLAVLALAAPAVFGQGLDAQEKAPQAASEKSPDTALSEEQIRELVRQAGQRDLVNDRRQRDYTYVEDVTEKKLSGGSAKTTKSKTYDVMMLYGEQVRREIAEDGKPLSAKDAAKEEEKIDKLIEKRKKESDEERSKRLDKEEKDREEARKFVGEIANAFHFRLAGMEDLDGREAYVIDAEPRPDYKPHDRETKILPKFRFRVWIDKAETQWVKLDAQFIDTASFGWFLVRLHPGSRVQIEQTKVEGEVWLPRHIQVNVDARVALLKTFREEIDVEFSEYKKFRVDTKILPAAN